MSLYRRMLIFAILNNDDDTPIVISFVDEVITLNTEGRGRKSSQVGTEVILNG